MKINTVNVIEYADDSILSITSFSDDTDGNKEAEDHFKSVVKEQDKEIDNETLDSFVEDGYYEQGQYQAFLTHS